MLAADITVHAHALFHLFIYFFFSYYVGTRDADDFKCAYTSLDLA